MAIQNDLIAGDVEDATFNAITKLLKKPQIRKLRDSNVS